MDKTSYKLIQKKKPKEEKYFFVRSIMTDGRIIIKSSKGNSGVPKLYTEKYAKLQINKLKNVPWCLSVEVVPVDLVLKKPILVEDGAGKRLNL